MKSATIVITAVLFAGNIGIAFAEENADELTDFTQRDAGNEWFVCHTENHLNDRFVNNIADRDFCHDVTDGTVLLTSGQETGAHITQSKILCNQRNENCLAPE